MPLCASVKKKSSRDQCTALSLAGSTLCGRHIKMKKVVLWADVHKDSRVTRFQAVWKGWRVRRFFTLCGPGVLSRAHLANDEDLVTCVEKEKQNPLDYFGVLEDGKVWWFDFGTIFEWCSRSVSPTNPYTRTPIPKTDLVRLHTLHLLRRRRKMSIPSECTVFDQRMMRRWNNICHLLRYYGFEDVHSETLVGLNHVNLCAFFRLLRDDLMTMNRPPTRALHFCLHGIAKSTLPAHNYKLVGTTLIQGILLDTKSYDVVFLIMSSLYRC